MSAGGPAASGGGKLRVVSLLPSATDSVRALGLLSLLVGRTHECDWPEVAALPALTGDKLGGGGDASAADIDAAASSSGAALAELATWGRPSPWALLASGLGCYAVDLEALRELRPDVILTQLQGLPTSGGGGGGATREAYEAALSALLGYAPRVVHLAATDLAGAWADVGAIAAGLGEARRGETVVAELTARLAAAADAARGRRPWAVACIQWAAPWYAAGGWCHELLRMAGANDVVGCAGDCVAFEPAQLAAKAPEVLLFAICGFGLDASVAEARRALAELPAAARERARVLVVDGVRVFSRPGPWLVESLETLVEALHPEAQRYGHEGRLWARLEPAAPS
jgi:iron complex transport system substrate-binding protein